MLRNLPRFKSCRIGGFLSQIVISYGIRLSWFNYEFIIIMHSAFFLKKRCRNSYYSYYPKLLMNKYYELIIIIGRSKVLERSSCAFLLKNALIIHIPSVAYVSRKLKQQLCIHQSHLVFFLVLIIMHDVKLDDLHLTESTQILIFINKTIHLNKEYAVLISLNLIINY